MTVVVVGAGIAGLACARELVDAGVPTRVLERGDEPGGRLASVFLGGRYADIGAAYVTADDSSFQGRLQSWRIEGLARPWTDMFRGQRGPGPMRWAAPGGLRSLAHSLAAGLEIMYGTEVTALPDADHVVLAMPGPEALRITDLPEARAQSWDPVLTAVLTYPSRTWDDFGGLFVNDHPVLTTVCDDGDRRGDRAPVLVAHSTPQYARDETDRLAEHAPSPKDETDRLAQRTADPRDETDRLAMPGPHARDETDRLAKHGAHARDETDRLGQHGADARDETDRLGWGGVGARDETDRLVGGGWGKAGAEMAAAVNAVLGIEGAPEVACRLWPYAQPGSQAGDFARRGNVYLCGDVFGRPRVQTAWLSGRAVARDILRARTDTGR